MTVVDRRHVRGSAAASISRSWAGNANVQRAFASNSTLTGAPAGQAVLAPPALGHFPGHLAPKRRLR